MALRTLKRPPSILPLYLRAAAPLVPGAGLLPFLPGGGGEIPKVELKLDDVSADVASLAAYARVCGFTLSDDLPPTYPHVLAFPLHMALMADGSFPFGAVGLVHIENEIVQHRRIAISEPLTILVSATPLQPHLRGRSFSILTQVSANGEVAWESVSTMLRREGAKQPAPSAPGASFADGTPALPGASFADGTPALPGASFEDDAPALPGASFEDDEAALPGASFEDDAPVLPGATPATTSAPAPAVAASDLPAIATLRLPSDLGRRYGAVSGDRNPIHLHALTAKPLGFPTAIAHGMWSKARCLAALESQLPSAFKVSVRFKRPIPLPSKVKLACAATGGEGQASAEVDFALLSAKGGAIHLEGHVQPVPADQPNSRRN